VDAAILEGFTAVLPNRYSNQPIGSPQMIIAAKICDGAEKVDRSVVAERRQPGSCPFRGVGRLVEGALALKEAIGIKTYDHTKKRVGQSMSLKTGIKRLAFGSLNRLG